MARRPLALALAIAAGLFGAAAPAQAATDATGRTGEVRFVKRMTPEFDRHVLNTNASQQAWLNKKFWRTEVFTPFFDNLTSWYGKGWVYKDLYAIGNGAGLAQQRPEWVLKSGSGEKLFIPWGCSGNWCPQYAADITNPEFRAFWIADLKRSLAKGYKGAWIDDVNMERRVSTASGTETAPYSATLGRTMSKEDWRKAVADFTEQIRREIPAHELLHNSIWYAGGEVGRDRNADIQRQIDSADYINLERGFNDGGLTGGGGEWSVRAVHAFIDRVHARGKGVVVDAFDATPAGTEYSLANYLLINSGRDGVGEITAAPDNWWRGWDSDLGVATTGRYDWQGLMRRDFTGGLALVNEPGAPSRTVALPQAMTTIDGRTVTSVTVGAGRGAVLFGAGFAPGAPDQPGAGAGAGAGSGSVPGAGTGTGSGATPGSGSGTGTTPGTSPGTGSGSGSGAMPGAKPAVKKAKKPACKKTVRVSYPTVRWNAKKSRLVKATGSAKVCISPRLKNGTKAHRAAVKKAKSKARLASVRKAKAARRAAVRAGVKA